MYRLIFAVAMILGVQTFALANGGGSSKKTGSIKVVNKSATLQLAVAVDPSASLSAATTPAEFTARGGKIINAGGNTTITNLKTGKRNLFFAFVPAGATTVAVSSFTKREVTVVGGKTVTVDLTVPASSSSN